MDGNIVTKCIKQIDYNEKHEINSMTFVHLYKRVRELVIYAIQTNKQTNRRECKMLATRPVQNS